MNMFNFFLSWSMAYSIHGHIYYILEASSEKPNDFSLVERKLNKILQFKWKRLLLTKIKPKLNLKFMRVILCQITKKNNHLIQYLQIGWLLVQV